jgi:hypothetical protein
VFLVRYGQTHRVELVMVMVIKRRPYASFTNKQTDGLYIHAERMRNLLNKLGPANKIQYYNWHTEGYK